MRLPSKLTVKQIREVCDCVNLPYPIIWRPENISFSINRGAFNWLGCTSIVKKYEGVIFNNALYQIQSIQRTEDSKVGYIKRIKGLDFLMEHFFSNVLPTIDENLLKFEIKQLKIGMNRLI